MYRIVCSAGEYIGSTTQGARKRWTAHRTLLRTKQHHSPLMQAAHDAGIPLRLEVLQHVESDRKEDRLDAEQVWMGLRKAEGATLFNVAELAHSRRGVPQPPNVAETTRQVHTGRIVSAETRARQSKALKGRIMTPEWRAKLSAKQKAYAASDKGKAALSAQAKAQYEAGHGTVLVEAARAAKRDRPDLIDPEAR